MPSHDHDAPRIPRTLAWGIGLATATALISGVSVYVNAFAVRQLTDPVLFTTLKNGVAAIILVGLMLASGRARSTVPRLRARQWLGLATIGFLGGGLAFILFFDGLATAGAPAAAFIRGTLFVWVAMLAVPFLGERLGWAQLGGLGILMAAELLIGAPAGREWGGGGILIAAATVLWAIEVIVARRLLADIPSSVGAAARMVIGLLVLVTYLALSGRSGAITALNGTQWSWVLFTGVLLAGYVATWYAALRRAPATVVTCVLVAAAPTTALLSGIGEGQVPAVDSLAGYGLVLAGAAAMAWVALRVHRPLPAVVG